LAVVPGNAAAVDRIPKDLSPVAYTMEGITGTYDGSGEAALTLYLNGQAVATQVKAKVAYDFDGDGVWDREEETAMMPTDGVLSPGQFEKFTPAIERVTGSAYADFHNGRLRIEIRLLNAGQNGGADCELKVDAPTDASRLDLPYRIALGHG
jgi:hypothetical protein